MDVGLVGLVDFVGYPVGGVVVSPRTGGSQGGFGRQILQYMISQQLSRSVLDGQRENFQQVVLRTLVNRVAEQWHDYQTQLARINDNAIFATILSEV